MTPEQKPQTLATIPRLTLRREDTGPALVSEFITECRNRGLSQATITRYSHVGQEFFQQCGMSPREVRPRDVRAYLAWMSERGATDHTLYQALAALRSMFRFAEAFEIVPISPARSVQQRPYRRNIPKPLSEDEINRLIEAATKPRDRALLYFMYATGCRISEVANAKIEDVNWDARTVRVIGKGDKQRLAPLNARAIESLRLIIGNRKDGPIFESYPARRVRQPSTRAVLPVLTREEAEAASAAFAKQHQLRGGSMFLWKPYKLWVFAWRERVDGQLRNRRKYIGRVFPRKLRPVTARPQTKPERGLGIPGLRGIIYRLARTAGLGHVYPHRLRHSFATHLLDHNADLFTIKELMGHASISTTQIYAHVSQTKVRETLERCHPHWKATEDAKDEN